MIPAIQKIDDIILNFIQNNMHSAVLDCLMPVLSWIGGSGVVWIITALLLMTVKKYRTAGFIMIGSMLLCVVIGDLVLKSLIARIRPCNINNDIVMLISRPKSYSFPSGHTMSSFSSAAVLCSVKKCWGISGYLLALIIAFSRLYLYVHYPSDIIGGVILGTMTAFISIKTAALLKKNIGRPVL